MGTFMTTCRIWFLIFFFQIGVFYNIQSDDQKDSFMIKKFLRRETLNDFDIEVCAR